MAARGARARATVRVLRLPHHGNLPLPSAQTIGAAGLDVVAALDETTPVVMAPGSRALIPTGLVIELPARYEAQVRPRSGLALRHGVTVLNSPGTIDADYRGEVQVLLINLGDAPFEIRRGDRIAQIVVQAVGRVAVIEVQAVRRSTRGSGGFGSTGVGVKTKPKRNSNSSHSKTENVNPGRAPKTSSRARSEPD